MLRAILDRKCHFSYLTCFYKNKLKQVRTTQAREFPKAYV